MEVNLLKEHEDGSATYRFEMTQEESKMMVIFGIRRAMEEAVQRGKEWKHDISESQTQT